jgi:hypothetical protein
MPHPIHRIALFALLWVAVPAAATEPPVRVAVISDINGRYGSADYHRRVTDAVRHIIALRPDAVISTGDMVAGQRPSPLLDVAELEALWRTFHTLVHAPLQQAGIPLVMTPGNHDASAYPAFAAERDMFARYHARHPPQLAPRAGGNPPYYFAVDAGPLRLVSLDATQPGPLPEEQRNWLDRELAGATPKPVLVFGHLPLQPVSIGRERDIITDPALEALLARSNVAAYLSGHHHAYYPGWRGGVAMLSVGNLGGNQRMLIGTQQRTGFSFLLLELTPGGDLILDPRLAPDFQQTLHLEALPEALGTGERSLQRFDMRAAAH